VNPLPSGHAVVLRKPPTLCALVMSSAAAAAAGVGSISALGSTGGYAYGGQPLDVQASLGGSDAVRGRHLPHAR